MNFQEGKMEFKPCLEVYCIHYTTYELEFPEMIVKEILGLKKKVKTADMLHVMYSQCLCCKHFKRFDLCWPVK